MPMRSKAQNRFMHAAAADPEVAERLKISPKVAKKFVKESHGQKVSRLPERTKKLQHLAKGGSVSRTEDDLREEAQERMNMISARGDAAVRPGPQSARERTEDIDNFYETWDEMPSPGKGVLNPKGRRRGVQTQPERHHRRLDQFEAEGQKARAIGEKAREQGRRPPSTPAEALPKRFSHGGSVDKPSCKW